MPDGQKVPGEIVDTGLSCLVLLLRYFNIAADPAQIRHDYGKTDGLLEAGDLIRCAKRAGALARLAVSRWERLGRAPLPAIAVLNDGSFVIFARFVANTDKGDRVLIQDPRFPTPELKARDEICADWNGQLIYLTHREALAGPARSFDLSWFIPAIIRYRRLFGEVLAASFFVQVMGLVSPLFFQVVTDKVLVHRGLSSLDVLAVGLALVSVFEALLGAARSYVFLHTASRVDVELGAQLFHHLMGLPLSYFGARRAGTTVARVRELENIRNFLTGSALTLLVDAVFTVVFFAVMFAYSATLAWIVLATIPLYAGLSLAVTPLLKRRIDQKFHHGAASQAFLVETVGAAETCKAMAVEPQMQRKWEGLLAAYVRAGFRAQNLNTLASQAAQGISKAQMVLCLWFGAKAVMDGEMTIGALVAFNMMAGRVASPILRLAQLWQDFQQMRVSVDRLGDILNTPTERSVACRSSLPSLLGRVTFDQVRMDAEITASIRQA